METTNDKEQLLDLFKRWGVPYHEDNEAVNQVVAVGDYLGPFKIRAETVDGYSGFFTTFEFSKIDGSFIKMGAWE